jgi:FKBP-type peptidyl-prolyl cis-trans isomerase FkpA
MYNHWKSIKSALQFAGLFLLFASCFDDPEANVDAQLKADLAVIDQYLLDNNIAALKDAEDQIRYVIHIDDADGVLPTLENCVTADFNSELLADSTQFSLGDDFSFSLAGDLIEGWKIGIPLLKSGDSVTFYIPSGLAYGQYGIPLEGIPPNANIITHFKLMKVGTTYSTTPSPAGSCN